MRLAIYIILIAISCNVSGQYSISLNSSSYSADFDVRVGENISFADLDVEIGDNIMYEDFSIGFTNSKYKADVIISNSSYSSDLSIYISNSSYADLDIDVSENQIYEDISIELKTSGSVDYLVYNERNLLSKEQLVVALLPIINAHLDYKFDEIPYWSESGGIGEPEDVLEAIVYCCPNMTHWIEDIDDRLLTLDDGSVWIIYDEDTFTSTLWMSFDNVKIESTPYTGHYYIHKYDTINEEYETVRAICVKS